MSKLYHTLDVNPDRANRPLVFLGDIHGQFYVISNLIAKHSSLRGCNLIQVGDFGVGFVNSILEENFLRQLDCELRQNDIRLYVIRGNHDNPAYWGNDLHLVMRLTNITFVKDFTLAEFQDKKVFFIGGGISVDRTARTEGVDYWSGEALEDRTQDFEGYVGTELDSIDILVMHTGPSNIGPNLKSSFMDGWLKKDSALREELFAERKLADFYVNFFNPKFFYCGHFHRSETFRQYEPRRDYRILDINEIFGHPE